MFFGVTFILYAYLQKSLCLSVVILQLVIVEKRVKMSPLLLLDDCEQNYGHSCQFLAKACISDVKPAYDGDK